MAERKADFTIVAFLDAVLPIRTKAMGNETPGRTPHADRNEKVCRKRHSRDDFKGVERHVPDDRDSGVLGAGEGARTVA